MAVQVIPILASSDFDRTVAFYELLGFDCTGRWPGEYLILRREGGVELHFWHLPEVDPATSSFACYLRFDGADEVRSLYTAWAGAVGDGGRVREPVETDYGMTEAALIDPDGNLIRFGA